MAYNILPLRILRQAIRTRALAFLSVALACLAPAMRRA